jgi:hypothetical protein
MIINFQPENTDTTLYLESENDYDLGEILKMAREKWPEVKLDNLIIRAEKIHTRCLTYDLHDEADWDNFIVIEKRP